MSYPHANSAYFHHQQPQQQPQSHSLPQHFQRGNGGYTQHQLQQQQQQQASYDGQAYNNGATMNYHHTTGGSGNPLASYQQQQQQAQGGSQGFTMFGGDAHSQQQQQQQHSHHGNGAAAYSAGHGSPYIPQSNAYPSSGAHSSSIDEHYQHPHHQHQQQFSSYDSGHSVDYSHGPHASHHHHHPSLGGRMGSPGLGSSRDSIPGGLKPKRRQVKNACINCQKACKKCDEGRPCSRCIKYGLTDSCVDSLRKERKRGIKRGPYKRRATTSSSNAASSSGGGGSSSASGSLMSTSLDSGHHGYHAGHSSEYSGGGGLYRTSTLPSSSSSYNNHNGGSLFQRDQPRSAVGPDVKPNHNSSAWQQQQPPADVKGSWTGLSHSSSSASSTDAQSSRLPMLNVQSHGGYNALDNGGSTGGRVALSPAPTYGSQNASSASSSVGQTFRLLPTTTNGPSNFSMSTQSGVPPHFHQRYPSDTGATSLYSSSGATPSGSTTSGSSANFSSPRTPLTAELTTNGAVGLPSVSDLTSPPMHSTGLYLKSPGLTGAGQQGNNLSASYMLSQPQQSTGAPQRQFALQMPPMPRGRGGGMVDMFNGVSGPFRGGAHYKVDPDEAPATTGALTTTV